MSDYQLVPPAERLSIGDVFADAALEVQLFMVILIVLAVGSVAVWALTFAPAQRRNDLSDRVLSSILVCAPLLGLTAAAYNLFHMALGIANVRPAPNVTVMAPGFAEASLCLLLGLLAASFAAAFRAILRLSTPSQS